MKRWFVILAMAGGLGTLGGCTTANPDFCDLPATPCSGGRACVNNVCLGNAVDASTVDVSFPADARVDASINPPPDVRKPDAEVTFDARIPDAFIPDAPIACGDAGMTCPADEPVCKKGACGPCEASSDCTAPATPVCTEHGACTACTNDDDCSSRSATPHCATSGTDLGQCVACLTAADCPSDSAPICSTLGVCSACSSEIQCMTSYPQTTPHCELAGTATGECVACRTFDDCDAVDQPICSTSTNTCVACTRQPDCVGHVGTPNCQLATGACVGCRDFNDCTSPDEPTCSPSFVCEKCSIDADCAGRVGTTHCNVDGSGSCVQCNTSTDCGAAAPVCDGSVCRVCRADSECSSDACDLSSGECLAAAAVIYVDNSTTTASTACTQAHPCTTIAAGLAVVGTNRKRMNLKGTYTENVAIEGTTVNIVGSGAILAPTTINVAALSVTGSAVVGLVGLTIQNVPGTTGNTGGDGLSCFSSTIVASQVTIRSNEAQGIDASSCTLTLDRMLISGNNGGGIQLSSGTFVMTNSFVVSNGSASSLGGGVRVLTGTTGHMDFNTIASNVTTTGEAAGVSCPNPSTFGGSSDILYGNGTLDISGSCTWTSSDIGITQVPILSGNDFDEPPQFVSPTDFHIMATSPCVGVGDPGTPDDHDYDGDPRTGKPDVGADQVN